MSYHDHERPRCRRGRYLCCCSGRSSFFFEIKHVGGKHIFEKQIVVVWDGFAGENTFLKNSGMFILYPPFGFGNAENASFSS